MDVNDILKLAPIDDIAEKFGVSTDVARQAVQEGSATLLGGLAKSAETESGSAAIEKALGKHGGFSGASRPPPPADCRRRAAAGTRRSPWG